MGLARALEAMGFPTTTLPPAVGNKTGAVSKEIGSGVLEAFRFPASGKGSGFFLQGINPAVLNKESQRRGGAGRGARPREVFLGLRSKAH